MGMVSSAAAVLVGVAAFGVGLWPVTLLSIGYVVMSTWRRRRRSRNVKDGTGGWPSVRYPVAAALLVLSVIAFISGGVFSPLVLAGSAVLIMAQPSFNPRGIVNRVKPVENSILLRSALWPFAWTVVSEVKLGTTSPPRALSAIQDRLVLGCSGNTAVYVIIGTRAATPSGAERKMIGRLCQIARRLSPLEAYILPLEASRAASVLSAHLERAQIRPDDLLERTCPPFDTLVLDPEKGRVARIGAYSKVDGSQDASLPVAFAGGRQRPLLWELLEALGDRVRWPRADAWSSFLNSLQVTGGQSIGERLAMVSQSGADVQLEAAGGAKVELSRAQLRALMTIYA
ncbi:MAG: hypothetical protein LYZ70_00980 [Nitrososphaerales archaeon]|nr:hypothetical protein [Nitrososphaerales archaeon]